MKRVNVHEFYFFGYSLRPLTAVKENVLYTDVFYDLFVARDSAKAMLNNGVVPLRTCRVATIELIDAITAIVPEKFEEAIQKDMNQKLTWGQAYRIETAFKTFETILAAELQLVDTYSVSAKGVYSTSDLIEHADRAFSDDIRKYIPPDAIRDLQQGGRCIAFDVPTAAAFHLLRSIESVMLMYHDALSKKAPRPEPRNWGNYVDALRKLSADKTILEELDQIREKYRNPIMHPEDTVSLNGAIGLFGKTQFILYAMIEQIIKLNP